MIILNISGRGGHSIFQFQEFHCGMSDVLVSETYEALSLFQSFHMSTLLCEISNILYRINESTTMLFCVFKTSNTFFLSLMICYNWNLKHTFIFTLLVAKSMCIWEWIEISPQFLEEKNITKKNMSKIDCYWRIVNI